MVNNEPTTQAIAVSLGIEVMNRAPLLRTCEWLLILGAFSISSIIIMFRVLRRLPHPRFESYCALFKTV